MKIELICFLYDKKIADMDLKVEPEDIIAKVTLDTDQIESVRQVFDGEDDIVLNNGRCMLSLKSGDSYEIGKSYEDVVKLWKE